MSSSNNSQSVPIANEYNARSPEVTYKRTRNRTSTPVKYSTYAKYYNYTKPAKNSKEYQNRFRVTPPSSPFRFGVGSPSPMRRQSPRISERQRKENEKLKAAQKRNENRRKKEAAEKKAKEEAAKKPKTLEQQLKNAKTLSNLKKIYKKGALQKHPNKGGTKSNFQKWKNLFNKLEKQF